MGWFLSELRFFLCLTLESWWSIHLSQRFTFHYRAQNSPSLFTYHVRWTDRLDVISLHKFWLSPVPKLSFLPAPYKGWTRAGEKRVQDNLHAHAQNEPIKNDQKSYYAARVNVSRDAFFSSRSSPALNNKHLLWRWYCGRKQIETWFIVVCTLIGNEYAS